MANETPDFMRARNATDIASQVSVTVPCQSFKLGLQGHSVILLLSYLLVDYSQRRRVAP